MVPDVPAIQAVDLTRRFGDRTAVDGLSLSIRPGELYSLLGPNGAGKTTTIRMLSALLRPTSGSASVMGHDLAHDPIAVKQVIGVSPQATAVARNLTVVENLRMIAGLHGVHQADVRIEPLLAAMALTDRRDDKAKHLSGGMQRRLSIAMALVSDPEVIFLDEPTIGLDPQARRGMWEHIADLKGATTILLTTHYLEEADAVADRVGVIDGGRLIAEGTPAELKSELDRDPVTVIEVPDIPAAAIEALERRFGRVSRIDGGVEVANGEISLIDLGDCLRPFDVDVRASYRKRASLDDVFLDLTGKEMRS
jgi:ABC-2 type transport system ATP-binding protein